MRNQLLASILLAAFCGLAAAAPAGQQVVHGQATFTQQGNVFSITNTPNTIINWQSFNINAGDITRFIQQSGDSAVLNRIVGQNPSQILGALQSNGHVFLINPNGILFGKGSRVDVGGLTASTLALSDNDFLAGRRSFKAGAVAGGIEQQGAITTKQGGRVFLLGSSVENSGIITTPEGQVVLAAGHSVQLADSGNPSLHVVVSAPESQAINLGQLIAQGGKVGIYGALVGQRGVVNADSAQLGPNGQVVLRATRDATLSGTSVTSARGGGAVSVEGERVALVDSARVDTSGQNSGGSVLIGGGYQGRDPSMRNASHVLFGKNAVINADGTGGRVVLWGEQGTRARGTISARGTGGLVETSGKWLDVNGVQVQAATWLLDPYDIEIGVEGLAALTDVDQFGDPMTVAFLNAGLLSAVAPGTNVVLQATHDVRFSAPVDMALGSGSLQVDAGNSIQLNSSLRTGGGALRLTANHPAHASGSGQIVSAADSSVDTGGGQLFMQAASVGLVGPVNTGGANLFINGGASVLVTGAVGSGNGDVVMTADDIHLGGSSALVNSGTGAVVLNATGGMVQLDSGARLRSGNYILFNTDRANLLGDIDGVEGKLPLVNFVTYTEGRGMSIGGGPDTLALDPARLAAFDASGFNLGHGGYTGNIDVNAAYGGGRAGKMVMTTQGNIRIAAPVTLPAGQDSSLILQIATRPPGGGARPDSSITTLADVNSATVIPGGRLAADHVSLHANNMSLGATISGTGTDGGVELGPHEASARMVIGAGAEDSNGTLGLNSSELGLVRAPYLRLEGNMGQADGLTVTPGGMDFTGVLDSDSLLQIGGGTGDVLLDGSLTTPGLLDLTGRRLRTAAGARAVAYGMGLRASGGVGAPGVPFDTTTSVLVAHNDAGGANAPINVSNIGALSLGSVLQTGSGVQGAINIVTTGDLDVLEIDPENGQPAAVQTQGPGGVTLTSGANLTVSGLVRSINGPISMDASNGVMHIAATGIVASDKGNIGLTARDLINDGKVHTASGNIAVTATTFAGSGTYEAPGGTVTGLPPPVPTITECLADPARAGCGPVLKLALDACVADPSGPLCSQILPSLAVCISNPATYGCSVVLPSLATCTAAPSTPGCSVVLPSLATCTAAPSTPGCSAVLPSLATCTAAPSTPGCSAVLPSLATCTAAPSTPGCSVVLPSLATCTAAPSTAGCSAVLPSLATCTAAPSTAGCSAVLPSLATCTAAPSTAGCSAVLPSLATCTAAPSTAGCSAVLPSLATCTASPSTAGCSAVLPSLATCTAAPSTAGCSAVLPSLATCTAAPSTAGCSAVLPSLATCTAAPSTAGCSAVLPSLATCTAAPSTAGCSVVLPSLATCTAAPSTAGCSAVLPSLATCTASPATAGCSAVLPSVATCTASPSTAGCSVVLPSLAICTTAPSTPGCSAVLPSLPTCTANPTAPGCAAVLPTLSACMLNPAAPGCSVVLPSLAVCIGNAATPGCSAVLPPLSACVADPARAGCAAVLPTRAQCLASPTLQGCSAVLPLAELCSVAPAAQGCIAPDAPVAPADGLERESRLAADAANDTSDKLKEPGDTALVTAIKEGDPANARIKTYCN